MAKNRRETASVSFHYLQQWTGSKANEGKRKPFAMGEFEALCAAIEKKPSVDLKDEEAVDRLRYRVDVPLDNFTRVNQRTIFGRFQATYSGHAYQNTKRGKIPADSISLRPFFYIAYLSESGRIYLAAQYLGQFGGYGALQSTLLRLIPNSDIVSSHSFRLGNSVYKDAKAKEVRISFFNNGNSIASDNVVTRSGVIAFKKMHRDDGFEKEVGEKLLPILGQPQASVRKVVADLLNESDLMEVSDSDIQDCSIIADVNGRRKTIYLFDDGNFASRFPLEVPFDNDGHPILAKTKDAMIKILTEQIISKAENV